MKASETVRPVWSAVRVVQVHIGSNCKEVCFGHTLVAYWQSILTGGGAGKVYGIPTALPRSCGAGRALLCLKRHLGREESASSVVPMPSGAVVTQWQVPAVEAISRTIMVLRCLGPIKAPRAGVKGRVVWASRFRGPGMATKECWGAPLHQLVHNPETGDATGSCSLAGRSFFFFFFFFYEWPGR